MQRASLLKIRSDEARHRGDLDTERALRAEQRKLSAKIDAAITPIPRRPEGVLMPPYSAIPEQHPNALTWNGLTESQARAHLAAEIDQLCSSMGHRRDSSERLDQCTLTYLLKRRESLQEIARKVQVTRLDAVERPSPSTTRAALRLDAAPTESELLTARATVARSGVAPGDREGYVQRLAKRAAWFRARDRLLCEAGAVRHDAVEPTADDRAAAAVGVTDPASIDRRARELAAQRVAGERRAQILASLPPPPAAPRLPALITSSTTQDDLDRLMSPIVGAADRTAASRRQAVASATTSAPRPSGGGYIVRAPK